MSRRSGRGGSSSVSVPVSLSLVLVSLSLVLPVQVSAVPPVLALVLVEPSLALSCPLAPEQATSHIQLLPTRTNVRHVMLPVWRVGASLSRATAERLAVLRILSRRVPTRGGGS
jgi:hypothetical protein